MISKHRVTVDNVRAYVTLDDTDLSQAYVTLALLGRNVWRGFVGAPRALDVAIDSREMIRRFATAAVSFANAEGADL